MISTTKMSKRAPYLAGPMLYHTIVLLLHKCLNLHLYHTIVLIPHKFLNLHLSSGKWQRSKYVGVSLVGKTLAVMGFGKVGSEVARRAKGLGLHVVANDPYAPADRARALGIELVPFDVAISTADFISLHMPLTQTTNKLFNEETFAKVKKGVRIVNVARGGVIDEEALVQALDDGTVAQVIVFSSSFLLQVEFQVLQGGKWEIYQRMLFAIRNGN